jgi:hypothetical protein
VGVLKHCDEQRCVWMQAAWKLIEARAAVLHQLHEQLHQEKDKGRDDLVPQLLLWP